VSAHYKQKATHRLNRGEVAGPKYNSTVLHRKITVDGQTISVYAATAEEFYCYVYDFLLQHYNAVKLAEEKYVETFDLDWTDWQHRISAIEHLDAINQSRIHRQLPVIQLFADE
jgi:hypothetical protein